jgi:polyisoprenoid-binding protein YceI
MTIANETVMDAAIAFPEPGTWIFDTGHSRVGFEGRHLMVSRVRGGFTRFAGAVHVGATPAETTAELTIEAASVESGFADRDNHLRSGDWFDVDHHPQIIVRAHSLRHVAGQMWAATADLTIRGITRAIPLSIEFFGAVDDPWGNRKLGFTASAEVNREEWGLTWNMVLEAGGLVASRKIRLDVDVEAIRQ